MAGRSTGGSLISERKLKQLYASMLQCRLLAQHARRLRSERRALYTAWLGQEAMVVGCVIDLRPEDMVALAPGGLIAALVKGAALGDLVGPLYMPRNAESRPAHNIIEPSFDEDQDLALAHQLTLANQRKRTTGVVVAFATAAMAGRQRSLRLAVRHRLPLIMVVENKADLDLPLKAPKNGLTRMTVDGNDVVAVYRVAYESLERVRLGGGPVLIEGKSYQAAKSRRRADCDPLIHMEQYLGARGLFNQRWKDGLVGQFSQKIGAAVEAARYLRASPRVANN